MMRGRSISGGGLRRWDIGRRVSSSGHFGPRELQFELGQVRVVLIAVAEDADLRLRIAGADGYGGEQTRLA